jgi:hypothetical protein
MIPETAAATTPLMSVLFPEFDSDWTFLAPSGRKKSNAIAAANK